MRSISSQSAAAAPSLAPENHQPSGSEKKLLPASQEVGVAFTKLARSWGSKLHVSCPGRQEGRGRSERPCLFRWLKPRSAEGQSARQGLPRGRGVVRLELFSDPHTQQQTWGSQQRDNVLPVWGTWERWHHWLETGCPHPRPSPILGVSASPSTSLGESS